MSGEQELQGRNFTREESIDREAEEEGRSTNGMVEFIAPGGGVSMLDISTRLRITEAELNIVRREVSELLSERNTMEVQCRRHRESWKFALQQLGRAIEQRNEAVVNSQHLKSALSTSRGRSPEAKKKKAQLKAELEGCRQQLETQTHVSRQLEHERDRAYDDYEFAKAQLATLMLQHQDLMGVCAEVTREKDKALNQAQLLREELNRYDSELHSGVELEGEGGGKRERVLLQQVKLLKEDREHLQRTYQQTLEQYKRQLNKANLDRRQAMASADAMRALLQRRLDAAQAEAQELRQELKASDEMVNSLKVELAQMRITQSSQWQRGVGGHHLSHEDAPVEPPSSQVFPLKGSRLAPRTHLNQESLYGPEGSGFCSLSLPPPHTNTLISPSNPSSHQHAPRVSSARSRTFVPSTTPFPEENPSQSSNSQTEDSSWI